VDASGNGRNGAYTGSPTFGVSSLLASDPNTCITTTAGGFAVPHTGALNPTTNFSIEVWCRPSSAGAGVDVLFDKGNGGAGASWVLFYTHATTTFAMSKNTGGANAVTSVAAPRDVAYHLVVTYGTTGLDSKLYLNGVDATAAVAACVFAGNVQDLTIGYETVSDRFTGQMDEPAVYGTILSPARVAAHYAAGIATVVTGGPAPYFVDVNSDTPKLVGASRV
jgi:hypothetical protein